MSTGIDGDWENTIQQLRISVPIRDGKTWLRHQESSQAALIDLMLLEGRYTIEDIAAAIDERFGRKPLRVRIDRVKDHIAHLQDGVGDSRRHQHYMEPHGLRLKEVGGIWSFDLTN